MGDYEFGQLFNVHWPNLHSQSHLMFCLYRYKNKQIDVEKKKIKLREVEETCIASSTKTLKELFS